MKPLIVLHNKLCQLSLKWATNQSCRTIGDKLNLRGSSFPFTCSVQLLLYCRCINLSKGILFKKIRNHSQPLKLQQIIKIFHKFTKLGHLEKVARQLEILIF